MLIPCKTFLECLSPLQHHFLLAMYTQQHRNMPPQTQFNHSSLVIYKGKNKNQFKKSIVVRHWASFVNRTVSCSSVAVPDLSFLHLPRAPKRYLYRHSPSPHPFPPTHTSFTRGLCFRCLDACFFYLHLGSQAGQVGLKSFPKEKCSTCVKTERDCRHIYTQSRLYLCSRLQWKRKDPFSWMGEKLGGLHRDAKTESGRFA